MTGRFRGAPGVLALMLAAVMLLSVWRPAIAEPSEVRIGLVIGNSSYRSGGQLPNAQRDAELVARTLREIGFTKVVVLNDADSSTMRRALRDFSVEAEKADWAVVYYAGHGIEVGGTNYLIPVDARLAAERDAVFEAVPLDQVLTSIEAARKLRLVILDACRDNPFIRAMTRTVASRSLSRGLARVEPEGGTLVAYAAKAGQLALDGSGQNSPFVTALTRRISEPGLEINMVFRAVRDDVLSATDKQQEPFVYGSLPNQAFYFKPPAESHVGVPAMVPVALPPGDGKGQQSGPVPSPVPLQGKAELSHTRPANIRLRNGARAKATVQARTASRPARSTTSTSPKCFSFGGTTHCE